MLPATLVLLLLAGGESSGVAPGTYEIGLCSEPCPSDSLERADVRGLLVVAASDIRLPRTPATEFLVAQSDFILYPNAKPNACFVLETRNKETNLLAGIHRVGLTRWAEKGGIMTLTVYRSPDVSDIAATVVRGDRLLAGPTEETRIRSSSRYRRSFLFGKRTGPPDVGVCIRAAQTELDRQAERGK